MPNGIPLYFVAILSGAMFIIVHQCATHCNHVGETPRPLLVSETFCIFEG